VSNPYVKHLLTELDLWKPSSQEVVEYRATALIEDFKVPVSFVIDMMHELRAAIGNEYGD
jgi:hypothetical protein